MEADLSRRPAPFTRIARAWPVSTSYVLAFGISWAGFAPVWARASGVLAAAFRASWAPLIVGVLWAFWHAPLFLAGGSMVRLPFASWAVGCVATSFAMAWLLGRTGRSLRAVTVFHIQPRRSARRAAV